MALLSSTYQSPRAPVEGGEDGQPLPAVGSEQAVAVVAAVVDLARVRALVEPIVAAHQLELVDLEWATSPGGRVLRVVIERPGVAAPAAPGEQGGVTLDDCVSVSRDVSTALDAVDPIAQHYNLEVSSPGLDRPLTRPTDFVRHVGRLAKVKLSQPASDGQVVLRGTIVEADEGSVSMDVDGKLHVVPHAHIKNARLQFELAKQPKKSAAKKGGRKKGSPHRGPK
jgi:ribosome maturation factor RimP